MLNWYKNKLFPWIMNKNIGKKSILHLRRNLLSNAYGNILEIGVGTGINLSLYPQNITKITAIDNYLRETPNSRLEVELVFESVEKMSFSDNTFDTVVSTFSLCSIRNLELALNEIYRVLKPGGQLIFLEHGKSKRKINAFMQNILNPFYNLFACGCNINRSYIQEMKKCEFTIDEFIYKKAPIYPKFLVGDIYYGIAKK